MKVMTNKTQTNGTKGLGTSGTQVWPGRDPRGPQPGPGRHQATVEHTKSSSLKNTKRVPLTLACWNVRTLLDINNSDRPQRRTALVSHELARYNIDITAVSETRLSDEGQLKESSGYTFFWKGLPSGEFRHAGVGFAVRSSLLDHLVELPSGFSECIMSCRLDLGSNRFLTLISVYAPTMDHPTEETEQFYSDLGELVRKVPREDKIALMGDFNARVGSDFGSWPVLGKHGIGKVNRNGLALLTFCTEHNLSISSTFFQQKDKYKATWMHSRSKHWHLIDYILVRKSDIKDVHSVRTMRGAECWTDHRLVRAKFGLTISPKFRKRPSTLPKRINVSLLKNPDTLKVFQENVNKIPPLDNANPWPSFRDSVSNVASEVLGFKTRRNANWFDDNQQVISPLLDAKHELHTRLLASNIEPSTSDEFKKQKSLVQRELRSMKDHWWRQKALAAQAAADRKDSKAFYSYIHEVFGPTRSSVAPVRSKDGSILHKDVPSIQKRWVEHYSELLNRPSSVDMDIINSIPQRPLVLELDENPTYDEVASAIRKLNNGKAPDINGLTAEVIKSGGDSMVNMLHQLVCHHWEKGSVPQEWIDAVLVSLYKSGGQDICGNFRGISLLSVIAKVLARVQLDRLNTHIVPNVVSESQCGFRPNRGTTDMVFSLRQLQEKCIEQNLNLYHCFIDLSKAFDTVNREALWVVLGKCGCPPKFVSMIKSLHADMKARVNFGGTLSEPFNVDNGVKQGDLSAPTLFAIFFACMLIYAFKDVDEGIYIRYRSSGSVFDLGRLKRKFDVFVALIQDLLYADDCDLVAHTEHGLQLLVNCFDSACDIFGFTINIPKTKVMFQPAPGNPFVKPSIFVKNKLLDVVKSFVYLGSTVSQTALLDCEISARIQKAAVSFGNLSERVWSQHNITPATKVLVYMVFVITSLLYTSETWTTYAHHIKSLERFHQKCLRHILKIKWQALMPDTEVLSIANVFSIDSLILLNRLRWAGHLVRLEDTRIPKQLFFGEIQGGKRRAGGPKLRFKDVLKSSLNKVNIPFKEFEALACNRSSWRSRIRKGVNVYEKKRIAHQQVKRAARKGTFVCRPDGPAVYKCPDCDRILLSKAGLASHARIHKPRTYTNYDAMLVHQCKICNKICKSAVGLKLHLRVHKDANVVTNTDPGLKFVCNICQKACRSLAGLKSHFRANHKN